MGLNMEDSTFTPEEQVKAGSAWDKARQADEQDAPNTSLISALAAAQGELKNPKKTRTAIVKGTSRKTGKAYEMSYKYADIGDVLQTILPVLSKHGICVSQPTKILDNGSLVLITRVSHVSGQFIESEYPICGSNGDHQQMGAALTYARRYALTTLIGVSAVDDTDGSDAAPVGDGGQHKMSMAQAKKEVNWQSVEDSIKNAPDFKALNKLAITVEDRRPVWPDSYYSSAKEMIYDRRLAVAEGMLEAIQNEDELTDAYADIEAALQGSVREKHLGEIFSRQRERITLGSSPLLGG